MLCACHSFDYIDHGNNVPYNDLHKVLVVAVVAAVVVVAKAERQRAASSRACS